MRISATKFMKLVSGGIEIQNHLFNFKVRDHSIISKEISE